MNVKNTVLIAEKMFESQPAVRVDLGPDRHFLPADYHAALDRILAKDSGNIFAVRLVGKSFEGRPIRLLTAGSGRTPILLWSQMHGDESTATAAIADIINYLIYHGHKEEVDLLLSSLTLHFLPMLNPDGAFRRSRRTAQHIDMNRDAAALQTPEAVLLKNLQYSLKPEFGFNLHDQELSTTGSADTLTAIALLAPALDHEKSDNEVRRKAISIAAVFAEVMKRFVNGKIAKYDDSFEPRAFGDNVQKWGTSTLLVESGHVVGDPQKALIRRLNFAGILATLVSIANGAYREVDRMAYDSLPFNTKRAYDYIIRNVAVETEKGEKYRVDLGISSQVDTHSEPPPRLVDVGDLHTFVGWKEVDGTAMVLRHSALRIGEPMTLSSLGIQA